MIRVYLAEDSLTVVAMCRRLLEGDPEIQLVGVGRDGMQAKEEIPNLKPDILLTDLNMPRMNGLELIRWVMAEHPLPILVISNTARMQGSTQAFQALEAGALEIGPKPRGGEHLEETRRELHRLIHILAGVRVIHRRGHNLASTPSPILPVPPTRIRMAGVGASTGGPQALQSLFQGLGRDFRVPLLVVQHIAEGFLESLTQWLSQTTSLKACIAEDGALPRPGCAHFAPAHRHLEVDQEGRLRLRPDLGSSLHVPSVDVLFHSLAKTQGPSACGMLLTGMGRDGAEGLLAMRLAGCRTLAQAEKSCMVYGMPKAAVDLQAACSVLELDLLPGLLHAICR